MKTGSNNDSYIKQLLSDPDYKVSSNGRVMTLITETGKRSINNSWRNLVRVHRGYNVITYKRKALRLSRIIYMEFAFANGLPKLTPQLKISHLDGSSLNDDIDNLMANTQSRINRKRFNKHPPVMGNTSLTWADIVHIRRIKLENKLSHSKISKLFGISKGHVSEIVNNKIWIEDKQYAKSKNLLKSKND